MSTLATLGEAEQVLVSRLCSVFNLTFEPVEFNIDDITFEVRADGMTYQDAYDGERNLLDLITIAAERSGRRVEDHGDGLVKAIFEG